MRAGLALAALVLLASAPAAPAAAQQDAVQQGLAYLAARMTSAGSSTNAQTAEVLGALGIDPRAWPTPADPLFSHLLPYGDDDESRYYSHMRIAYAVASAGLDPRDVAGVDHVAAIRAGFANGQFGSAAYVNDDAWAILALRAAGVPASDPQVQSAIGILRAAQRVDGGWSYLAADVHGWTDVTGAVLAALRSAGEDMAPYARAKEFLDSTMAPAGGHFDKALHGYVNGQSTAWALHGYASLGVAPSAASVAYLASLQRADGGFANGADAPSNPMATSEILLWPAGGRHPLPGHSAAIPQLPTTWAGEPATVPLPPGHTSLDLAPRAGDVAVEGRTLTFPRAGDFVVDFRAVAPAGSTRGVLAWHVLSARPVVGELPAHLTLHRHAPLALDLSRAADPDGRIVGYEVDWGDGNVTSATTHAYPGPGSYQVTVRARDDAGVWSRAAEMRVDVVNRAPVLGPLPTRVLADRVREPTLDVAATDPDGDALEGLGRRALPHATIGNTSVEIVVRDAYGAEARTNVTVEVVNLPPRVALRVPARVVAGEEVTLDAEASDEDGPAPTLHWSTGGPRARFAAGAHVVRVVATDADGARAEATATLVAEDAREERAAPSARPPEIRALDAAFEGGALVVRFEAEGAATLRWRSDAGEDELRDAASPVVVPLAGATWARVELTVERDGLVASRESGLVVAPAPAPAPAASGTARREAPTPVVVAAADVEPSPPPAQVEEAALVPAALRSSEAPPQETPGPSLVAALALVLALAATRRRRAS